MKVYISGGIKDVTDYELNFQRGAEHVRALGGEPVNPCELEHAEDASYADFMREDIRALLDCDAILMLDGWASSRGARLEHDVAVGIGLEMMYELKEAK